MNKQSGFTLIELMVVISIIGILAAIAIPQFSKYRERAMTAEGYELAGAYRQEVAAYYDVIGTLPISNDVLGLPAPESVHGKYVSAVSISDDEVRVRFNDQLTGSIAGKIFRLVPHINPAYPSGPLTWEWIVPPKGEGAD